MEKSININELKKMNFKDAMDRISDITNQLEAGECELEEMLHLYEEATILMQVCEEKIKGAKVKINHISNKNYISSKKAKSTKEKDEEKQKEISNQDNEIDESLL